ncbi:MAG: DUF2191 domain-containing protein [Gammaproteobacteria bacterium]|nr:DUF2191 domain-containing protein [Gammaproteobacteria bacterium]
MKTTLNLNDDLLARAKAQAARQRTTLTRLIEEGLQARLRGAEKSGKTPVELPIYHGKGGLASGLNGLSNKGLLSAADDDA